MKESLTPKDFNVISSKSNKIMDLLRASYSILKNGSLECKVKFTNQDEVQTMIRFTVESYLKMAEYLLTDIHNIYPEFKFTDKSFNEDLKIYYPRLFEKLY